MYDLAVIAFWASVVLVAYTYCGYPLLVAALARIASRQQETLLRSASPVSVSIVVCAYDEEERVAARLAELLQQLETTGFDGEVILVSDGSTDATVARARAVGSPRLRVVDLQVNVGKAEALNRGFEAARGSVVVLADARQHWAAGALTALLRPFEDPVVQAATGELVLEAGPSTAGVGLYWRFEKWLRRTEAVLHSPVGVTGAICAVRREWFAPLPPGTLLDDVYWPMQVVMAGGRVAYAGDAVAYDRLPAPRDEFRRKVRTLAGNFQLMALLPQLLLPWRNPLWLQFVSHKLLRLVVPWVLVVALVSSRLAEGLLYQLAFVAQVFFYAAAALGMAGGTLSRFRLTSTPGSFVLLNAAAMIGFWVWVTGNSRTAWRKARYAGPPGERA